MSKKIIFSVVKNVKVTCLEDSFREINKGYYLNCKIDEDEYNIAYLGTNIDSIALDSIKNLVEPTNIHSMMHVNLNNIDCNEVLNALEEYKEYYLLLNNNELVKYSLLDSKDVEDYNNSFEEDLKEAAAKYGVENITLIKDVELYMYYICCFDKGTYETYKENYYSMEYIDNSFVEKMLIDLNCKYEIC